VHLLRRSFLTIQASIEALEVIALTKGKDSSRSYEKEVYKDPVVTSEQERFAKDLDDIAVSGNAGNVNESFGQYIHQAFVRDGSSGASFTRKQCDGGSSSLFGGMDAMKDHTLDINVSKMKFSNTVGKAFVLEHWLAEDTPGKCRNSAKQASHISKSDYKRHFYHTQTAPFMVLESGVNKKLKFHTPSPDGIESGCSKSTSKYHQSGKKVIVKYDERTPKRSRKSRGDTLKVLSNNL